MNAERRRKEVKQIKFEVTPYEYEQLQKMATYLQQQTLIPRNKVSQMAKAGTFKLYNDVNTKLYSEQMQAQGQAQVSGEVQNTY